MNDRRRLQISLRTLLMAAALVPPFVWLIHWWSPSVIELVIGLTLLVVPELVWSAVERKRRSGPWHHVTGNRRTTTRQFE